jgi:hypothetical protein
MCIRPLTRCSLHATADIFALLKSNQDEPDPLAAQAVGLPLGTHALRFIVHYAWGRAVVVAVVVVVGKIRDFHQPVLVHWEHLWHSRSAVMVWTNSACLSHIFCMMSLFLGSYTVRLMFLPCSLVCK